MKVANNKTTTALFIRVVHCKTLQLVKCKPDTCSACNCTKRANSAIEDFARGNSKLTIDAQALIAKPGPIGWKRTWTT